MPDARTLPIPAAHREFTIRVNGQVISRQHQLVSATLCSVVNRIAWGRLVFLDGSASAGEFALSSDSLLLPGSVVEVSAGAGERGDLLFEGVVVRHALRMRDHSGSQLIIECRHQAMKLAIGRRGETFLGLTDREILESLFSRWGVAADVAPTSVTHEQVVQYQANDWDFLLARARVNGLLIMTRRGRLVIQPPALDSEPVCSLTYGATLLEFDAELDARNQFTGVNGLTWDPIQQIVVSAEGSVPEVSGPGNVTSEVLADVAAAGPLEIKHVALDAGEAQAWASSIWQISRLNKVCGRAKCEGLGSVETGDVVTLAGVGQRFSGNVLVTGVRHEFDLVQGWKTHLQFGGIEEPPETAERRTSVLPAELLPRVAGLQIGVVVSNEDPAGEHRVRIRLPMVSDSDEGIWARLASLGAGPERGFCFRPEIGDEVVAGFLEQDPRRAVILGTLHSSAKPAPFPGSDANHEKLYASRSGMRIYFNDQKNVLKLQTPAGNCLVMDESEQSVQLSDQSGNSIVMNGAGIRIESTQAVSLKAGTELKLEGTALAELTCGGALRIAGTPVQIN